MKIKVSSYMCTEAWFDRICDAVIQCKDGFTVDDVIGQLEYDVDDLGDIKDCIIEDLACLVKDNYLRLDDNKYYFSVEWKKDLGKAEVC